MTTLYKREAEGGCGVIGIASSEKIAGRHLLPSLCQMKNRGNGKGGGIAAVGLDAKQLGVTDEILENDYLIAVGYLDESIQGDLEREMIHKKFIVDHIHTMPRNGNFDVTPPKAVLYFVRVKESVLEQSVSDEIVYRNSQVINETYYASEGLKQAFVLSHGKNLLVLKMVGFGDDVIHTYQLENFLAHIWIGHHRYPTKGKVWHPGGAHPFIGLNEALVHNGDFANYFSLCSYLKERGIYPHFLTDTEVAVLLFDLLYRTYQYPLEYVIEALAPTTMRDFTMLPEEKKQVYRNIQKMHMRSSPDGPWFFLIAQSIRQENQPIYRLLGITDTSMLRPQVFALQQGEVSIGFAASEKQAIDATLRSLSLVDTRFWSHADHYWNARGGSYTDGGAYNFSVTGQKKLTCKDKFGKEVHMEPLNPSYNATLKPTPFVIPNLQRDELFEWTRKNIATWSYDETVSFLNAIIESENIRDTIDLLTILYDRIYPLKKMRRSSLLALIDNALTKLFDTIVHKKNPVQIVVNAFGFESEGDNSLARHIVNLVKTGFKKIIVYQCQGQRFIANGLGSATHDVQIDVYGSAGDYISSGIDGAKIIIHNSAQDQVAQIMKEGTLVIHGDVGQAFLYGAKGGVAYVRGNAAGRPLINAVSNIKAIINGTSLDYLAESFMAGNPLQGGGFVILNGVTFDDEGMLVELETPYSGNNLFSLASGGAIYIRDPKKIVNSTQLNGGHFVQMSEEDWKLILPYLEENERLFDIPVDTLLTHEGKKSDFKSIYRKIAPAVIHALQPEEAWVKVKT